MTTYAPSIRRVASPLCILLGALAIGGGTTGLLNPVAFSTTMLGIPVDSDASPAVPFASFVGARNLGSGVTLLALLYAGERKAVGIFLMSGVLVAWADAWISAKYGAAEGKAMGHAVMGVLVGALGGALHWAA